MTGRLKRGKAKFDRNIFKYLTTMPEQSDSIDRLLIDPAVRGQAIKADFWQFIVKTVIQWKSLDEEFQNPVAADKDFIYDKETRAAFQPVFAALLRTVNTAILGFFDDKNDLTQKHARQTPDAAELKKDGLILDRRATAVNQLLRLLSYLTTTSRHILESHLAYLQQAFSLQTIYCSKEIASGSALPSDIAPTSDNTESSEPTSVPSNPASDAQDLHEGDLPVTEADLTIVTGDDIAPEMEKITLLKQDNTDYLGDFAEVDSWDIQKKWDKAALKYLDLICMHRTSLYSLQKKSQDPSLGDKALGSFLNNAIFEFIRPYQLLADKKTAAMRDVLSTTEYSPGVQYDEDDIKRLQEWVKHNELLDDGKPAVAERTWTSTDTFDGNFHCETVLLSLHLLARQRDQVVDQQPKTSKQAYLELPDRAITDRFESLIKYLPTSKPSCPACHALVEYYMRKFNSGLMYEGHHENWFACALPPWLPREAGEAVMAAAENKLKQRMYTFKNLKNHSDAGSSTRSSPVKKMPLDTLDDMRSSDPVAPIGSWLDKQRTEEQSPRAGDIRKREVSGDFTPYKKTTLGVKGESKSGDEPGKSKIEDDPGESKSKDDPGKR
jgi:hypothetical protein